MKIYVKSTKVTSANDDMQTKVNKLAKAIHDFYYFVWDPYELEESIPSVEEFAKLINEEIASGRKEITLDDEVSYNLQELYKDIRDDDSDDTATQAKNLLDELKALRGIMASTKSTTSIDTEIINRAKEVVDYLNSHNKNLNRKQEQFVDDLANAINSKSISGIRSAIEDLKYNSKNLNNKQYALVIDLYDDFNLADGKFNGMGKIESSTNPITSATNPQEDDYRLLGRLESDCKYVLDTYNGGKLAEKYLWAGNVEDQIAKMYELYDRLKVKPEWITREDIDEYARRFDKILNR